MSMRDENKVFVCFYMVNPAPYLQEARDLV